MDGQLAMDNCQAGVIERVFDRGALLTPTSLRISEETLESESRFNSSLIYASVVHTI